MNRKENIKKHKKFYLVALLGILLVFATFFIALWNAWAGLAFLVVPFLIANWTVKYVLRLENYEN